MNDFLPEQEMEHFQVGGLYSPSTVQNQVSQLQGQATQLKDKASQYANNLLKSAPLVQGQATQYANNLLNSAPLVQGQATQYANNLLKSAPALQGQATQYANNLLNSVPSLKDKVSQLTGPASQSYNKIVTLLENLAQKGEGGAIRLLGSMLGVSVANMDPNKLVDALNNAAQNPETQQKILELTDNLIKIGKKPLEDATAAAASLIGDTLDKEGKQGIKLGWDLLGAIPVAGEFVELVRTGLDTVRAGEVAADAVAKGVTIATTPLTQIQNALLGKNLPGEPQEAGLPAPAPAASAEPGTWQEARRPPVQTPILPQGGGAATEKQYNQYKKLQLNAANRLSQSFQGFYGTRKQRKGSRKRGPKIHMKTRTRRTKRAKY